MTRVLVLCVLALQQAPAKRSVEFTGTVLMNAFYNSARTNNSDVPVLADTDATRITGGSATMRQTRLGVFVTDPDVLGGSFSGEVDVDFFGGQQPAAGNRMFPLRRATGTVQWTHLQLMIGQETPLVSDRNPRSLAGIGVPDFSLAGNLWFWLPQVRVTALLLAAVGAHSFGNDDDLIGIQSLEEGVDAVQQERRHEQEVRDGNEYAAERGRPERPESFERAPHPLRFVEGANRHGCGGWGLTVAGQLIGLRRLRHFPP
ncbi:MAG TPA: hypothetical protein VKQ05_14260 [Gemmatimonadales bacterium]|nr:hypothetical protein [Gemmatimonadales bacterium]